MKAIIILLMVFLSGCVACVQKPSEPKYSKDLKAWNKLETCYRCELCIYYQAVAKKNSPDCSKMCDTCEKEYIFDKIRNPENRPDKKSFDDSWHILR